MKTLLKSILALILGAGTSFAATGGDTSSLSPFVVLLLFFGGLIIAFQLMPGIFLFLSMVKGLFSGADKEVTGITAKAERK
ncbi:MAG: hypothetical protein IH614_18550 [Desulfuromonadales bacterium]|nr:hypothetical protein [Desulfuromonadales bacterium]